MNFNKTLVISILILLSVGVLGIIFIIINKNKQSNTSISNPTTQISTIEEDKILEESISTFLNDSYSCYFLYFIKSHFFLDTKSVKIEQKNIKEEVYIDIYNMDELKSKYCDVLQLKNISKRTDGISITTSSLSKDFFKLKDDYHVDFDLNKIQRYEKFLKEMLLNQNYEIKFNKLFVFCYAGYYEFIEKNTGASLILCLPNKKSHDKIYLIHGSKHLEFDWPTELVFWMAFYNYLDIKIVKEKRNDVILLLFDINFNKVIDFNYFNGLIQDTLKDKIDHFINQIKNYPAKKTFGYFFINDYNEKSFVAPKENYIFHLKDVDRMIYYSLIKNNLNPKIVICYTEKNHQLMNESERKLFIKNTKPFKKYKELEETNLKGNYLSDLFDNISNSKFINNIKLLNDQTVGKESCNRILFFEYSFEIYYKFMMIWEN